MSFSIDAAELGRLNVSSGLGEPLKADIELLSVAPEELSSLAAIMASEQAFAVQGIKRLNIHADIKVEIAKNAEGSPVLKLSSSQPISEPYLDMLIQLNWATGRLQREYTVLLDAPGYKPQADQLQADGATAAPVDLPSTNAAPVSGATSSDNALSNATATQPDAKQAMEIQAETFIPIGSSALTTKRGDTLNSLAKEMQVDGVSLDQMLVGLYRNNQEAFADGNMNRLKVGQIIKAPNKQSLDSISLQEAKSTIKLHSANWDAYRNNLAENVAATPVVIEFDHKQSASGKIASVEDAAAPVKSDSQDVVKLSSGATETEVAGKSASQVLDAEIMALQEEATARENALKEAHSRTANLEKQIADIRKLLVLKSQSMTVLQKDAKVNANVVQATLTPVVPKIQAELNRLESLINSVNLVMLGGVSGAALLGAFWIFLRNKRRKKDLGHFERDILISDGVYVFAGATADVGMSDTSFSTDLAQSADGRVIKTPDVEPIAFDLDLTIDEGSQTPFIETEDASTPPLPLSAHTAIVDEIATAAEEQLTANTLDLSTINLDMTTVQPEFPEVNLASDTTSTADVETEPQGVNIKTRFSGDLY